MTTHFSSFAFLVAGPGPATDSRVNRTLPTRLADTINVKDWGAVGDGVTDDTTAIRAAVTAAQTPPVQPNSFRNGVTLFFPAGTYKVTDTIDLRNDNSRITVIGSGRDSTIIKGNVSDPNPPSYNNYDLGFIFKDYVFGHSGGVDLIADMTIWNTSVLPQSGCWFQSGSTPTVIRNCHLIGMICADWNYDFNGAMYSTICECSAPIGTADSAAPGPAAQSVGCYWSAGTIFGCKFVGFDTGIALGCSNAGSVRNNYFYRCNVGIFNGKADLHGDPESYHVPGPNIPIAYTTSEHSNVMERCTRGMYANSMFALLFAGNTIKGTTGPATPAAINNIIKSGSTAIVTTLNPHNLSPGTYTLNLITSPAGWTPDGTGDQYVTVTVSATPNQFTYSFSGSPATFSSGTWNYPLEAGIILNSSAGCVLAANSLSARVTHASFDPWNYANSTPSGSEGPHPNVCIAMDAPYGWTTSGPWNTDVYAGFEFISCTSSVQAPVAFMHLGELAQNAVEGKQGTITDAVTLAAFGVSVDGVLAVNASSSGSNNSTLTFASVPAWLVSGMLVYGPGAYKKSGASGNPQTHVVSTTSTTVTLSVEGLPNPVGPGTPFIFGGTNKCKVRYDGTNWIRVA